MQIYGAEPRIEQLIGRVAALEAALEVAQRDKFVIVK